ncbi:MAG: hypothetical protein OXE41_09905 [Gammaproteobacteria bacterium]|nr:hypothetical protein [Gammaproteobacteria bacterium]
MCFDESFHSFLITQKYQKTESEDGVGGRESRQMKSGIWSKIYLALTLVGFLKMQLAVDRTESITWHQLER